MHMGILLSSSTSSSIVRRIVLTHCSSSKIRLEQDDRVGWREDIVAFVIEKLFASKTVTERSCSASVLVQFNLVASVDGGMYAFIWFLVLGAGFILFFSI